jgi:hypothetical protein
MALALKRRPFFFNSTLLSRSLDFVVVAGSVAESKCVDIAHSSAAVIRAHSFDYDLFLGEISSSPSPIFKEPYAVFLDEYAPFHPDYQLLLSKPHVLPLDYYPDLNRYFDRFEANSGLKVVIAAHPKADYDREGSPFADRPVLLGCTSELVRSSSAVLLHSSTSVSFPVLYKKPMIYLSSTRYSHAWRRAIRLFAKELASPVVDIDKPSCPVPPVVTPSSVVLETYTSRYIKSSGTADIPLWDIFSDFLPTLLASHRLPCS